MYDTEEHKIIITGDVNHPPIADAGGPYTARPGEEIILDGTGSYDPDPGDSISAYAWDLDGDGEYDDSDDPQPSIIWEGVKSGLIGLKVWDQDNLSSSDEAPVYVEVWTSEKDLAVTSEGLEVSNVRPEPGELITLTVTGQYTSEDEAGLEIAKVRFYNGNPDSSYIHIGDYVLDGLSSGDNFKITMPWTVPDDFKSSVWVKLDYDDQIMEFDETNNTDFVGLEVSVEPVFNTRLFFEPDPVRIVGNNIGDDTAFPGLVSLMVKDVYDLMGANIEISFDPDKVNVLDMFPGEFMERNADFVSDFGTFNNETGTITISLVRLDALPTGVTGSGAIADIFLVAVAEDPTSELIISSYSLRDSHNNEIWVMSVEDGAIEGIGDLLGDFENDLDVDFEDYTQLVVYWNEDDLTGDIVGPPEQPNMAGSPPWSKTNYPYEPDGAIDFEDQMVFALMYNWYRFSTGDMFDVYKPSVLAKRAASPFEIGLNLNGNFSETGNTFTVSIDAKNILNLMGSEAVLKYNHDMLRVKSVNSLPSPETDGITAPVLYKYESGMLRAGMAVLGSSFHGLSCPDCSLFEVEFEVIEEGPFSIELAELDVRNYRNEQVAVQILNSTVAGKTGDELNTAFPMMFGLGQNYPNPFNMSTIIGFSLAEAGMVEISIYNMLGQEVKSLVGEMRQPGRYTVVWNGTDEKGDEVTSGVYIVNLIQGNSADTRRLLLIK